VGERELVERGTGGLVTLQRTGQGLGYLDFARRVVALDDDGHLRPHFEPRRGTDFLGEPEVRRAAVDREA